MTCVTVSHEQKPVRFVLGALAACACVITAGVTFQERYTVAVDTQATPCIEARVMLVDREHPNPKKGVLMAFYSSENTQPVYPKGTLMAKYVVAGPGDTVKITPDETIWVNGKALGQGLPHLIGLPEKTRMKFIGQRVLGKDDYWVMGTHEMSFDSRYWGSVKAEQFIGRAIVLW